MLPVLEERPVTFGLEITLYMKQKGLHRNHSFQLHLSTCYVLILIHVYRLLIDLVYKSDLRKFEITMHASGQKRHESMRERKRAKIYRRNL